MVNLDAIEKIFSGEAMDTTSLDSDTCDLYNQLKQLQDEQHIRQDEILKYLRKMIRYQAKHLSKTNSDLQKLNSNEINDHSFSGQMITARNIIQNFSKSDDVNDKNKQDEDNSKNTSEQTGNATDTETPLLTSQQDSTTLKQYEQLNNVMKQSNHQEEKNNKEEQTFENQDNQMPQNKQQSAEANSVSNHQADIIEEQINDQNTDLQDDKLTALYQGTTQDFELTRTEDSRPEISILQEPIMDSYVVVASARQNIENKQKQSEQIPQELSQFQNISINQQNDFCDDISDAKLLKEQEVSQKHKYYENYSELDDVNLNNNEIRSRQRNDSYSMMNNKRLKKFSSMTEMIIKNGEIGNIAAYSARSGMTKSQILEKIFKTQENNENIQNDQNQQNHQKISDIVAQSQSVSDQADNQQIQLTIKDQVCVQEDDIMVGDLGAQKGKIEEKCEVSAVDKEHLSKNQPINDIQSDTNDQQSQNITQQGEINGQEIQTTYKIIAKQADKLFVQQENQSIKEANTETKEHYEIISGDIITQPDISRRPTISSNAQEGVQDASAQTDSLVAALLNYLTPDDIAAVEAVELNKLEPTSQKAYFETVISELRLSGRLQSGINIQLRKQVQELQLKVQSLENRLQAEKTSSMQRLKSIETNFQAVKAQNDALAAGIAYRGRRLEALRCENLELKAAAEEAERVKEAELETLKAKENRLTSALDAAKAQSAAESHDLHTRLHFTSQNHTTITSSLHQQINTLQKQCIEKDVEIEELRLQCREMKLTIEDQKQRLVNMQRNFIQFKKDTSDKHQKEITSLQNALIEANKNAGVHKYTDIEQKLMDQVADLKDAIADRDRQVKDLQTAGEAQKTKYEAMRADRDDAQLEMKRLSRELNDLRTCVGDAAGAASAAAALQNLCAGLRRDKAHLEDTIQAQRTRLEEIEKRNSELETQLVAKDEEIKKTVDFFQEKLNSDHFMVKYHSLKLHLKDVESQLNSSQSRQKGLQTQLLKLQTERDRAVFASNMRAQEQNKKRLLLMQSAKAGR